MKKILVAGIALLVVGAILAVGLYAALAGRESTFTTGSTVTFTATDAYVDIVFNAYRSEDTKLAGTLNTNHFSVLTAPGADVTAKTYVTPDGGKKITADDHAGSVTGIEMDLIEATHIAVYYFKFTNVGSNEVTITFEYTDITETGVTTTKPVGTVCKILTQTATALTNPVATLATDVAVADQYTVAKDATIHILITYEITDFSKNIEHNVDFLVKMFDNTKVLP